MSKTQKFEDESGLYTLFVDESEVKLECYLLGSPTGGTGTECFHTVGAGNLTEFLESLALKSSAGLFSAVAHYKSKEWNEFHEIILKHQTEVFVWHETDWSD